MMVAAASLAAGAADVKLMSFNVLHGMGADNKVDLARTASVINKERPDFAGLQEIDRMGRRSGEVDQPEVLASLTGMHATFAKAIPLPENGEYGVMVLSRKKPISVFRTPLPGREPRVLLLCEFDDCWFGTTHLSLQESNQVAAVEIIRKAVAERAATKPVFLTGDWNARPTSKTLSDFRRFMTVLSDESTRTFHGFRWHEMKKGEHCIDYIAVSSMDAKRVVVRESHVVPDVTTSDHSPVVATVAPATPPFVVAYTFTDDNELVIKYQATTNKKTIVNLTHHAFFSIQGIANPTPAINDQVLEINADFYLPIDETSIPTGEILKVAGTPFDFRTQKTVGQDIDADNEQIKNGAGYDHCFVLNKREVGEMTFAARLLDPNSGRTLEVYTTEPGMQVYSDNWATGYKGQHGATFPRRSAICFECQHFPDSPNRPYFPSVVLNPGEQYTQKTIYKFGVQK